MTLVASYENKWMNRKLTSHSMSMAASERDRKTQRLVENGKLGMRIITHQPSTDTLQSRYEPGLSTRKQLHVVRRAVEMRSRSLQSCLCVYARSCGVSLGI